MRPAARKIAGRVTRSAWRLVPAERRTWARISIRCLLFNHRNEARFPLIERWRTLRRGFLPENEVVYQLSRHNRRFYVTERARESLGGRLNAPEGKRLLDDKLEFDRCLAVRLPQVRCPVVGQVRQGTFQPCKGRDLEQLLEQHTKLVAKPARGRRGSGVIILESTNAVAAMAGLHDYIVVPYLQQDAYAARIWPAVANTIRVLMLRDNDGPFVAAAIHRFGTEQSGVVDNWSAGGISVGIDPRTGLMGQAVRKTKQGEVEWFDHHPDTRSPILGVAIPDWASVVDVVVRLGNCLESLRHVGWDVLVTANGPKVIEGNNHTDLDLIQVHRPLLMSRRVRHFYESVGMAA